MSKAKQRGLVVWKVRTGEQTLSCAGIACWAGEGDRYELIASGCSINPATLAALEGSIPVTLSVGPSSSLSRQVRGVANIRDIREGSGAGLQVLMSVELEQALPAE